MTIAIIDCGYIGAEVAALWKNKGFYITATTHSPEKLDALSQNAQKCMILRGNDEEELAPLIANNDLLVVTIVVDSPEHYESAYLTTAQIFYHLALETDLPRHLIYTSSTSIYGDHHGQWVDETSELRGASEQAKNLVEAEKQYLALQELGWHVCVLRFAEVYGPGRELSHRVKQLEGHTLPGRGDHYTNMIHKIDCASAIDYARRHQLTGIYNVSDEEYPSRKELYDAISRKFRLPRVKWDPAHASLHIGNKRVSNHKLKAEGFAFRHPQRVLS